MLRLYFDLGDDARAAEVVEAARRRAPESASTLSLSIFQQLMRRDYEGAQQLAQKLLELDPKDPVALFILRSVDLHLGHADAARARYAKLFPELLEQQLPVISGDNAALAVDIACVLVRTGEQEHAMALLDRSDAYFRTIPRLGPAGSGMVDVEIHALRGDAAQALAALRMAQQAGYRAEWRYFRDIDPCVDSIRDAPEFKAVFADIERDMATQRAALAARSLASAVQ